MTVFLLVLLILLLTVLSFDAVPMAIDFFKRIKIGTLRDEEWFNAAADSAVKWSVRGLPVVPKIAGKRFGIVDRIKGDYKSSTIQSWQAGSVLLGVDEIDSYAAAQWAMKFIDPETGEWSEPHNRVDFAYLAYGILSCDGIDRYLIKPAMDSTAKFLIDKFHETGSIPYTSDPNLRFVDTIGLACPFLIKFSLVYNNEEAMKAAIKLIKEYEENGLHPEFSLPVHCFNSKTKAPLGLYSWGRGCGWWSVGLAESFMILNETDPDSYFEEKKTILKNLLTFAKTIVSYQSANGSFDRNVFAHSGADSSATAMISYLLAYAGELTGNAEFTDSARKAMDYIYTVTRRDGVVDYSQGDTMGIGFYSQESIVLPATQGFALRTYMILNK